MEPRSHPAGRLIPFPSPPGTGAYRFNGPSTPGEPGPALGERRQVTVLFADIVGSVAISERLGEEGTHDLIHAVYELMDAEVRGQGGSVKEFLGDGIMALFGVPKALEDGPLRACRAALLIHERLAVEAAGIDARHGVRPQLRIGINTGLAVVSQIGRENAEITALGDTVNVAARLQNLAEPGTAFVSEATYRLVQGLVEMTFAGTHLLKGKVDPQKAWRLNLVRLGATRFDAVVGRGLSKYVGRERELDALQYGLQEARDQLRVIDIMGEPGMGKSRLIYEYQQRTDGERAFMISGSCSPDGQQTSFLPFIEVVRRSFQVRAGEAEQEVARKLDIGLTVLGLNSTENLGLLLNLLGLKPPEHALAGLDGMLIGLRTRGLLRLLLTARCRFSTVVLLIEDLHWVDTVSEELLQTIITDDTQLRLLIIHTRRPEYEPPWLDRKVVTKLWLDPLPVGDIRRLAQGRLGTEFLPDALAQLLTEKAEGNPLFAEEIVTFLTDRGVVTAIAGKVEFYSDGLAGSLPASVQGLLSARIDRLATRDRTLLQAAAVIGRRFESELLAVVADDKEDIDVRLAAIKPLDLLQSETKSGCYVFKHALVCDVLYQSMLTVRRTALHLKIAEQIERRAGSRLAEVVEILAYHYSRTNCIDKAFTYLAEAGAKSLDVYSLDEAGKYLAAAVELIDKSPGCATDDQIAQLLVDYTLYCSLSLRYRSLIDTVERFALRLARLSDSHSHILVQHHYVLALLWSARYRDAKRAQSRLSEMAARLRDASSRAYALASDMHLSTYVAPYSIDNFEAVRRKAIATASEVNDAYLNFFIRASVGWDQLNRGRVKNAHEAADELMAVGRQLSDPRSMGYAMALEAWIALTSDDYQRAVDLAEASINIARAPFERELAILGKNVASVLLRQPNSLCALREFMARCTINGWHALGNGADTMWGAGLAVNGEVGKGIRWMKQAIKRRDTEGYHATADWGRMFLCEIYLEIISRKQKLPTAAFARELFTLISVIFTAQMRIVPLVERVRQNAQFDQNGHFFCRCEMILGELYKIKKKRSLAILHLTEAHRIALQFGRTPMLARIEGSLAELETR